MDLLFIQDGVVAETVVSTDVQAAAPAPAPTSDVANVASSVVGDAVVEVPTDAQAVPAEAPAGGGMGLWIMIIVMIAIMYFFMWRPESKRRKQMQKFRDGLKKGDKIITAGGIYGVIKEVHETTVLIEVDGNVTLRVDKGMVVGDPTMGVVNK